MTHPLHILVGDEFKKFFNSQHKFKLLLDPACGGDQNIPFFLKKPKSFAVRSTVVDIMVAENNKVKIVCEIDESNVKPGHIFGKLLSLISSELCITKDGTEYDFDSNLIFIQVLSTEKLNPNSRKIDQWSNIEKSLRKNLKAFGKIKSIEYHILLGDNKNFNAQEFNKILSNL